MLSAKALWLISYSLPICIVFFSLRRYYGNKLAYNTLEVLMCLACFLIWVTFFINILVVVSDSNHHTRNYNSTNSNANLYD